MTTACPTDDFDNGEFIAEIDEHGTIEFASEEARLRYENRFKNAHWVDIEDDAHDRHYLASLERLLRWLEERADRSSAAEPSTDLNAADAEFLTTVGIAAAEVVR